MTHEDRADESPLLRPWTGPFGGVPPFGEPDVAALRGALERALEERAAEIQAIADDPAPPDFANTYEALERAGRSYDRVGTVYGVMTGNCNTPAVQELAVAIEPRLAEARDATYFNRRLFSRLDEVKRNASGLEPEQARLVEEVHAQFAKRGAQLELAEQERLGAINQRLAALFTDFSNRVLADEGRRLTLSEHDLDGLPPALISTLRAAAPDGEGYAVMNTRSAVEPFLSLSSRRDLREKVWRAFVQRGDNGDENDTHELITEIVRLRAERAKLLGFASHAHWRMRGEMAEGPEAALALMKQVWSAARAKVADEVAAMQKVARREGHAGAIEPWDYRYYLEKLRKEAHDLDQNEFKPYFELEQLIQASFFMAERLYGFGFEELPPHATELMRGDVPVFHPDVRVFVVTRKDDGAYVGLLYRDDYARVHKRSGAWMSSYRRGERFDGAVTPLVSNNNNFARGEPGQPVLLSLSDAATLFHEFGHALHALAMDVRYPTLTSTPRDFVEFPSQIHENWVLSREVLDRFARHVETGEAMPAALVDKLTSSAAFGQGFATVEYLSCAMLDMRLHMDPEGRLASPAAFEREELARLGMPASVALRHRLPHFLHLFATDSYSAGYYSYLWADVMAADAWRAFEETGDVFDGATARRFRDVILATGNASDRGEAYRTFRGRDPDVAALLDNRGLG
ncbi:MAG: M3 family metallopeptidase [Myxococcota bacterium]